MAVERAEVVEDETALAGVGSEGEISDELDISLEQAKYRLKRGPGKLYIDVWKSKPEVARAKTRRRRCTP